MSVGSNIKVLRNRKKMSQTDLGMKVGLSAAQISNIESKKKNTRIEKIVQIAKALECDVSVLYDEGNMATENDWILFGEQMNDKGIKPKQALEWIKLAKKISEVKD